MTGRILTAAHRPVGRRGRRAASDVGIPEAGDLVLVTVGADSDGDVGGLIALARAVGATVVLLPDDPDAADRIVWAARSWQRRDAEGLVRDVEAVVSAVDAVPAGTDASSMRCLRGDAVRRWARRAWSPCRWCPGGGVDGCRCARCRADLRECVA